MANRDSQVNYDRDLGNEDRRRRDLLVFLLILLLGFVYLLCTSQVAVRPERAFEVPVSVLSELDPDEERDFGVLQIEPLRPEVLTSLPGIDLTRLAPVSTLAIVPVVTLAPISPGTPAPQEVVVVPTPSPSTTVISRPAEATPTPIPPAAVIGTEWPARMGISDSDFITLSLVLSSGEIFTSAAESADRVVVTVVPVVAGGTPEASIERAFGPAYETFVVARLEGTAFEITPREAGYQSLDQPRIAWGWNIIALEPGLQTINACIFVRWESAEGAEDTIERTVWCSPLEIVVE